MKYKIINNKFKILLMKMRKLKIAMKTYKKKILINKIKKNKYKNNIIY
jgi:hypothetical protein